MTRIFLRLPKDRYSPIDYYLDELRNNDVPKANILILTPTAFRRMRLDTYHFVESNLKDTFIGREITIDGDYPILEYAIKYEEDEEGYLVLFAKSGKERYCFEIIEKKNSIVIKLIIKNIGGFI